MTKLEILQEGMDIVRRELTSALAWVLRKEYGNNWWRRGVIETLERDGQRTDDLPIEGNEGDLDLYTALKLVRNYHFGAFEKHLGWDHSLRPVLNSVAECRNSYEGHVTANREAELTRTHTQDLLQNMSLLLLRLHEDHEQDSVDLMRPLAQKLMALPPDTGKTAAVQPVSRFRPPTPVRTPRSPTLNGACVTVQGASTHPPVTKPKPFVSTQLDRGRTEVMMPEKPRDIHTMAPIPEFLTGSGTTPQRPLRRSRKPHHEETEEPETPVELSTEVWQEIPTKKPAEPAVSRGQGSAARRDDPLQSEDLSPRLPAGASASGRRTRRNTEQRKSSPDSRTRSTERPASSPKGKELPDDPFAVVPWITETETRYVTTRAVPVTPKKRQKESVFVRDGAPRQKHHPATESIRVTEPRKKKESTDIKKPGLRAWAVWILAPILAGLLVWLLLHLGG